MNQSAIRRSRTALSAAVLLLATGIAGASGTTSTKTDPTCAISADTVERRVAVDATLPRCVLREQARAQLQEHCAVTPDAAERRAARHPGDICHV